MHPKVAGAIQEIDAALFNGDTFDDPDDRAELTAYVEKWAQELGLIPSEEDETEDEVLAREPSEVLKELVEAGADFIRWQLRRPSPTAPVCVRTVGSWKDDGGIVHAVNAASLVYSDIDLGRETACGSTAWDPDNPSVYPTTTDAVVDCMTCIVRQVRSCP